MKVIYESVEKTIREAIYAAYAQNRRIARIDLTWQEANELSDFLQSKLYIKEHGLFTHYKRVDYDKVIGTYMGVRLQIEPAPPRV